MRLWFNCTRDCDGVHGDPDNEDGLIQKYIHLTKELEAPTSYHVFALLATIASATARRAVIDRGAYRLWPNLYVLLHGPSGLGKGIASKHAIELVQHAVGDGLRMYADDITGEGLFRTMREQTRAEQGSIGMIYADEFGELLGGQDYKRDLAKRLTKLYACQDRYGAGRGGAGELWAENVFLNILGNSQEKWLRTLPKDAIEGGLFARFLIVVEEKKRFWKYRPGVNVELYHEVVKEIQKRLVALQAGVVVQTKAAHDLGEAWYMKEEKRLQRVSEVVMPWCERRLDHAFKLGYLNSLLEGDGGPLVIDEDGMRWGLAVVEWMTKGIETAFLKMGETPVGELHRVIVERLVRNGGVMLERAMRAGLGYKWSKPQMDEALSHLGVAGLVSRTPNEEGLFVLRRVVKK